MFKSLRIKIIITIISVFTILLTSILISIYVASYKKSIANTDFILRTISENSGFRKLNSTKKKNTKFNELYDPTKVYLIKFDNNKIIKKIANDSNSGYTDQQLGKLALELSQKDIKGTVNGLSYLVTVRKKYTYVAFVNNSLQKSYLYTLFLNILFFGCIGLIFLFIISVWLSLLLVKPIESAFMKQKQFVSDASHELKTPVAIISANADALSREVGESKWLDYIHSETQRMNKLITDLLELASIDSGENAIHYKKINISETIMSIVLPFESIAYEKQISLNEKIDGDIYMMGDNTRLGQLIAILMDNALNHTDVGGSIDIKLKQTYDKRILTVSNTGKEIPMEERELIFERFYRVDEARTREKGSYGLGLSIARSIVKSHKGKISVSCKNNWTTFKVTF